MLAAAPSKRDRGARSGRRPCSSAEAVAVAFTGRDRAAGACSRHGLRGRPAARASARSPLAPAPDVPRSPPASPVHDPRRSRGRAGAPRAAGRPRDARRRAVAAGSRRRGRPRARPPSSRCSPARRPRRALWVEVGLPVLPNGTTGWVPRAALGGYRTADDAARRSPLARRRATLYRGGRAVFSRADRRRAAALARRPTGRFLVRNRLTALREPVLRPGRVRHERPLGGAHRLARRRLHRHPRHRPPRADPGRASRTAASGCATRTSCAWPRLLQPGTPVTIR